MDTTLANSIEQLLECAVCQERMNDAAILHCGHAFCEGCLHRSIQFDRNNCPLCREPLTGQERNKQFTPGLIFKNIRDFISGHNKAEPATSKQKLMCDKHLQNERKFICERCQKPVCRKCLLADHRHNEASPRTKTILEVEREMQSMVDRCEKWIKGKKDFDRNLSRCNDQYDSAVRAMTSVEEQVEKAYQTTLTQIKLRKMRLLATISEKKQSLVENKASLHTKHEEITKRAEIVTSYQSRIKDALKKSNSITTTSAYCATNSERQFEDSLSHPFPSLSATEAVFIEAKSSYFMESDIPPNRLGEIHSRFHPSDHIEAGKEPDDDPDEHNDEDDVDGDEEKNGDGNRSTYDWGVWGNGYSSWDRW